MEKKVKVAVIRCDNYAQDSIDSAVRRGIDLIGGMSIFIKTSEKIVLKPNVLVGDKPEKIIGPHPSVFKAVGRLAQTVTHNLSYGDSPAMGKALPHAQKAGLAAVADELGIPLADFDNGREVHLPDSPFIKRFVLANGVLDSDGLISIAKFKTHQLTRITGPIKNQFGCIPGVLKAEFHIKLPNALDFAKMLVCINLFIRPRLYIVDGIIAMQGNGPRGGNPVYMNVLLFSKDPVALEAVMCRLIHLNPDYVPTIQPAVEWGLGTSSFEDIELVGDALEPLVNKTFDVVRKPVVPVTNTTGISIFKNLVSPRPVIDPLLCNQCGTCNRVCPASPKAVGWFDGDRKKVPTYQYDRCIRCFCCQELCPEHAISVQTPLLGKIIHRQ